VSTNGATAYLVDAVRTPVGRHGGALSETRPDDLAGIALRELVGRVPEIEPERIDDVFFGNANGAGEENRDVARMAVLLAGLPVTVPGATVNRLCGSGMEAVVEAVRAIETGDAEVAVGGGVESMSRAPWAMLKPSRAYPHSDATLYSTAVGWRMVNPKMPDEYTVSLGEGAEILADEHEITRAEQDRFAVESHHKAATAWDEGRFADEVVGAEAISAAANTRRPPEPLERDEPIRPDASLERLAKLRPAFRPEGTVTAGNTSPLSDGASAVMLAGEEALERSGRTPLGRVVSRAVSGIDPPHYGIGPVEASNRALGKAGLTWDDIEVVELNEAFAAQSIACLRLWRDLDPGKLNVNGGAIALGHPLGSSGSRLLTTLAHELHRRGGGYGLATMCIGVGQGIAMVIEGYGD
jgi:acetyl-CoA acetyltransferase family protein